MTTRWATGRCFTVDGGPTAASPLRRAEFDDLFASDVVRVVRQTAQVLQLELRADAATAARAAALAVSETECCSFFTFELVITDGRVQLAVTTTPAHDHVLAALGARAHARRGAGG